MNPHAFFLFVGASSMIAIVPGPNVLLVVSRSASHGFRKALLVILGTKAASAIYLAATVAGLIAVLAAFPTALFALRVMGASYLAFVGTRMIIAATTKGASPSATPSPSSKSLFAQGFWTSFSNPKALLYWSAFLPLFIQFDQGVTRQLIYLGLTGMALETIVLAAYAVLASTAVRIVSSSPRRRMLQLIAGAILVAIGVSLGWNSIGVRRVA